MTYVSASHHDTAKNLIVVENDVRVSGVKTHEKLIDAP
jgi:hypothetical protein